MLKAKDLMTTKVIAVDPDDSVTKAVSLMLKHGISGLPVVAVAGRLLGVVSEDDLLDLVWDGRTGGDEVYHYMSRNVPTTGEEDDLRSVAEQFRRHGVGRLPVMRDERLVGIITRHDLVQNLAVFTQPVTAQAAAS